LALLSAVTTEMYSSRQVYQWHGYQTIVTSKPCMAVNLFDVNRLENINMYINISWNHNLNMLAHNLEILTCCLRSGRMCSS